MFKAEGNGAEHLTAYLNDRNRYGENEEDGTDKLEVGRQTIEDALVLANHASVEHVPPVDGHIASKENGGELNVFSVTRIDEGDETFAEELDAVVAPPEEEAAGEPYEATETEDGSSE